MVFVTVGTARQGFRRLLDAVEILAGEGRFGDERVFIQTGHNDDFKPQFCEYKAFLSGDDFDGWMEKADLIICHGGCTQIHAIRIGKIPVVMPRLKRFGEHVNDHQLQLVEALSNEGFVIPAYAPQALPAAIAMARLRIGQPQSLPPSPIISLVANAFEQLLNRQA